MDRVQHLRLAVITAHRLVLAIERGARPHDTTRDGAVIADVLEVLTGRMPGAAVTEALERSRARLTRADRTTDDRVREALEWTTQLREALQDNPRAVAVLEALVRAESGDTTDVALRDELYARATFLASEDAQRRGDLTGARAWLEAQRAGLDGLPSFNGDAPTGAMFRGDAGRTGDYGPGVPGGPRDWAYHTGAMVRSSPLVFDGTVYVGSVGGGLHAVDASSGVARWTHPTGGAVDASPVVSGDTVFVTSSDGILHAVRAGDGELRWAYDAGSFGASSPAVAGGLVVVGGPDATVLALDSGSGALRWTCETGAYVAGGSADPSGTPVESSPAIAGGAVYVNDGQLLALDLMTGMVRWAADVSPAATTSPAVAGGIVYTAELGGTVCAVDAADGTVRWRSSGDDVVFSFSAVAVVGGMVLACGQGSVAAGAMGRRLSGGVVLGFDAVTGRERWRHRTDDAVLCSPAVSDGVVYVIEAGQEPHLLALSATSGELRQRRRLPGSGLANVYMSSPAVAGDTIYVGMPDGRLLAMPTQGTGRSGFRRRLAAWWGRDTSGDGAVGADLPALVHATRVSPERKAELQQRADRHAAAAQDAFARGDMRTAVAESTEAVHAVDELRRAFPEDPRHTAALAGQLYHRAGVMDAVGETWQGAADARRALALYQELASDDPGTYTPQVLDTQSRLALLLASCGEHDEARVLGAEAVAAHRALVARHPGHEPGLARTLARYSEAMVRVGDQQAALAAGREALQSYRRRAGALGLEETLAFGRTAYNVAMLLLPPTPENSAEGRRAADDAVVQLTVVAHAGMGDAVSGARMLAEAFRTGRDPR